MEKAKVRKPHQTTQEECALHIHPNGTISDRGHLELPKVLKFPKKPRKTKGGLRSAITAFSKASASRLRRLLAQTAGMAGGVCFGLTLTVPGPNIKDEEWRRLWRAFLARARRLNGVAFIWRIEKQERGQPHIHCVCWADSAVKAARLKELWLENLGLLGPCKGASNINSESTVIAGNVIQAEYKPGWASVASREFWPGACEHAVKTDWIEEKNDMCWWRYLASHASKSKQAQLGWKGRQWGVFNKHLLALSKPVVIKLKGIALTKIIRYLKRITHNRHASNHGRQTWFVHPDTAKRLGEWATGNGQPTQKLGCSAFSPFKLWKKVKRERAKAERRKLLGVPECG